VGPRDDSMAGDLAGVYIPNRKDASLIGGRGEGPAGGL